MPFRFARAKPLAALCGTAALALSLSPSPASAQTCMPETGFAEVSIPSQPRTPQVPATGTPGSPSAGQTAENMTPNPAANFPSEPTAPDLSGALASAVGGAGLAVADPGYIDSAIPRTQFRLRFDAAYDDNRPDRAEFFYGKCGCFRLAGLDPHAPGPPLVETRIDYQDISSYLEVAANERLSGFVEVPVRFLNPQQNANTTGLADVNAGFKYAFLASQDYFSTFQFRVYAPTGDADRGLGTNHVSLEPAWLYFEQLSDRLTFEAEVRDWIPIGGTDFEGNVLRYGFGFSYIIYNRPNFRIAPITELVGWTVLSGKELAVADDNPDATAVQNAAGDTIVNAKVGVRFGFGNQSEPGLLSKSDLYVGYGRALTGDVWYKDILRVEYRMRF